MVSWRCFAAADWPRFRGSNGTGVAETAGLQVEFWSSEKHAVEDRAPTGILLAGIGRQPNLRDGIRRRKKLFTMCLNLKTGKMEWQRAAQRARRTKSQGTNTPVSPSPVTDGRNVYVFFEDFGLVSYAPDGSERWRQPLGPFNNPYGMAASPILSDGKVIQRCDQDTNSFLIALDAKDGHVLWKTERPEATHGFSTPAIYGSSKAPAQVIVSGSYQVAAYAVDTGEKLWWVHGMAWQAKSVPVVDGDIVYVHSWMASTAELGLQNVPSFAEVLKQYDANHDGKIARDEVPDAEMKKLWFLFDLDQDGYMNEREWNIHRSRGTAGNGLFAIRAGGKCDVTDTHVVWRFEKSLPNIPSPILYKGVMYVLREGGILTALDPKSDPILKQGRLEGALDPSLRIARRR
ncbi:MAG: hypothetical protein DMG57_06395 [Acidobacteria bacterium]|nr:MAG: hypothetical protein DMG57_06395 [Acidobacteriota bacterium]